MEMKYMTNQQAVLPDKITAKELMKLPLAQRRRIMRQQAEAAREYYPEIKNLGGGEFIDY
jgi:hypothetical protein